MRRAYIGFGALGRQLKILIDQSKGVTSDDLLFDDVAVGDGIQNASSFDEYLEERFTNVEFYLGIGYKHLPARELIGNKLLEHQRTFPSFIHASTFVNPTAAIGAGTVIYPCSNIDQGVQIGNGVFINNSVVISHDSNIGDYTFIAPGVIISGNVTVGKRAFIGAGAVIANGATIGDDVIIGVGSVITRDVLAGSSVIGNPMQILSKKLDLR